MTINLSDYIYEMDRADTAEENLKLVTNTFRVFSETARCYLCEEKIGTERWRIGEYSSGNKEVVHQACWDEEAERAASQGSYWIGGSPEKVSQVPAITWYEEFYDTPHYHSGRGGQFEGEAEASPGANLADGSTLEAFASSEGFGTYAREHGGDRGEPDAQGSWSPAHVAGCGGPIEVRVPERLIDLGNEPVTVRVPKTVKAQLKEIVRSNFPHPDPEKRALDMLARALKEKGIK